MAKTCGNCNKRIGGFDTFYELKDGIICENCFQNMFHLKAYNVRAYQDMITKLKSMEMSFVLDYAKDLENERKERKAKTEAFQKEQENLSKIFVPYKNLYKCLELDDNHNLMRINGENIYSKKDLITYQLYENGANIAEGGVGRAIVGDLLFGSVGAIVGAQTRKQKDLCTSLQIVITFSNLNHNVETIKLIDFQTEKDGSDYKRACNVAREIIAQLDIISHENEKQETMKEKKTISAADEILKIKQLLDMGAINQEEYDKLKAKIIESL